MVAVRVSLVAVCFLSRQLTRGARRERVGDACREATGKKNVVKERKECPPDHSQPRRRRFQHAQLPVP